MCGIVGKLNFDRHQFVEPESIQRMMDLIAYRGPDGEGKYVSGSVGLGHRRLSIIDLQTGNQPISNEDGTVWVVYNGEIYNFVELRTDLEARGHTFKSTTDTEVIVHLYEELEEGCVARLRGMFAFAVWDERKKVLLLARDRIGVKPLYYINTGQTLLFGSEMKSILTDPSVKRDINLKAIDRFLTFHYLPGNETMFDGIYKLEPGHYLKVEDGEVDKRQYWDLQFPAIPRKISFEDAVDELQSLLRKTVKDHMLSDVPVGVLLSGGVDSTGVLRYAVEQTSRSIQSFTIGFEGRKFADERPYARLASQQYGTNHHEVTMTADDFRDFLPKYVWHMEEPVCEPPAIALYWVSRLAFESSVKVLLSGEGGDEAFGGYQNYRNLLFLENLKSTLGPAKWLLRYGFQSLSHIGWKSIAKYASLVNPSIQEYYLSRTATTQTGFNPMKQKLYRKEFKDALSGMDSYLPVRNFFNHLNGQPVLNSMLYVDSKTWLPDDLLIKADKMTMATSVELRVPLLDFQVLDFAASLPREYKISGWKMKRVLKAALRDSVPREILDRKKTGLPVPYNDWLRGELKEIVSDTLLGQNSWITRYLDRQTIEDVIKSHQRGEGYADEVFSLVVLELWHRAYPC
jgi:asparagine synthase (glutamine-hydrolysing)